MVMAKSTRSQFQLGLAFAVVSAFSFGMSGPFAKALMEAGWSPTGAVTARLAGGALVMAVVATLVHRGWVREAWQHRQMALAYGVVPIAGAQLFYYNAVAHLSVAVALLLEYTAPILVVGYLWATTRQRPAAKTLAGVGMAVAGIMLVLNVFGSDTGAEINAVGVAWGLAAAVCAASYFVLGDKVGNDGTGISPITLTASGLVVGTVALGLLGMTGIMQLAFSGADVVVAGTTMSWAIPVLMLGVVATAVAYTLGIHGVVRLRSGFASLVGLAEVLFAVLWAWLLVGEAISLGQGIGGLVVLAGLALARSGDRSTEVAEATWPDASLPQNCAAALNPVTDESSGVGTDR